MIIKNLIAYALIAFLAKLEADYINFEVKSKQLTKQKLNPT